MRTANHRLKAKIFGEGRYLRQNTVNDCFPRVPLGGALYHRRLAENAIRLMAEHADGVLSALHKEGR
jgi:hypothetical protein